MQALQSLGTQISTMRKGNPWDNAPSESILKTPGNEEVYRAEYRALAEARELVALGLTRAELGLPSHMCAARNWRRASSVYRRHVKPINAHLRYARHWRGRASWLFSTTSAMLTSSTI